jgi:hypothetical protein
MKMATTTAVPPPISILFPILKYFKIKINEKNLAESHNLPTYTFGAGYREMVGTIFAAFNRHKERR